MSIVQSHEPTWAEGEAWAVSRELELTIGVLQGAAEYQLVKVEAAARQFDGDIVVVDLREVRLYDRHGAYVRTLGGEGSGPGEFQNPTRVLVAAADSVLVWDNALYRVSRFDSAGVFVDARSVDRGGSPRPSSRLSIRGTVSCCRTGSSWFAWLKRP